MKDFQINQFKRDLHDLLKKYDISLGVSMEGDTHGVRADFLVIDSNRREHIIELFANFLSDSDLKEDL